jgi:hypothetical protein
MSCSTNFLPVMMTVPGVVSAGVARHYVEVLGEYVDNLAFTFIAPLGAHHHCCITFFQ